MLGTVPQRSKEQGLGQHRRSPVCWQKPPAEPQFVHLHNGMRHSMDMSSVFTPGRCGRGLARPGVRQEGTSRSWSKRAGTFAAWEACNPYGRAPFKSLQGDRQTGRQADRQTGGGLSPTGLLPKSHNSWAGPRFPARVAGTQPLVPPGAAPAPNQIRKWS